MSPRKTLANLARRLLRAAGLRAVTKTVRGAPLRIPLAMGDLKSLLFDPAYSPFFNEDDVMDVLAEKIRPGDIVFDIGAYHGVLSAGFVEVGRKRPTRLGGEDPSRLHVVYERQSEAR